MKALAGIWIVIGGPASAIAVGWGWEYLEQWAQIAAVIAVWLLPAGWLLQRADKQS